MNEIVAVEVTLADGGNRLFLTWGRALMTNNPDAVALLVLKSAQSIDFPSPPVSARVCPSVRSARDAPFFHEALFDMARTAIPYGKKYGKWRQRKVELMEQGKEIWYLGVDESDGSAAAG